MAKFEDILKGIQEANTSLQSVSKEKVSTRKKTDITGIAEDIFQIDAQMHGIEIETIKFEGNLRELKSKNIQTVRQRWYTMFSNAKADSKLRTEEGIKAFEAELETTRRAFYDAHAEEATWKDEKEYFNTRTEKSQPRKFKDGRWKHGNMPETKFGWNVATKLIENIREFGFEALGSNGKVVPEASTRHWFFDEEGKLVKAKESTDGSGAGSTTAPKTPVQLLEESIKQLKTRLNKVDLSKGDGEKMATELALHISGTIMQHKEKAKKEAAEQE